MNPKSLISAALVAVFLCLVSACAPISSLADYASDNPLLASVAMRQAVATYIARGETLDEEHARADAVIERGERVRSMLEGDPEASKGELLSMLNRSIDWSQLAPEDRILVIEILALLEHELERVDVLDKETRLTLGDLFTTAISAAQLYKGLI